MNNYNPNKVTSQLDPSPDFALNADNSQQIVPATTATPQINTATSSQENLEVRKLATQVDSLTRDANWYDKWKDRADITSVTFAAIVFLVALLSNRFGVWLNKSNKDLLTTKEQLSKLQIAIVEANAQTEAKRIETEAKHRITEVETSANQRIEETRAQADIKIADAKAIAAKANERAGNLENQNLELRSGVANLEKDAATAKRQYLELLERVSPRTFTPEQRAKLVDALKRFPKGSADIQCLNGNAESCEFAHEISDLLKEAGWEITSFHDTLTFNAAGRTPKGVFLTIKDSKNPPLFANALLQGLNILGFAVYGEENKNIDSEKVAIFVGTKP